MDTPATPTPTRYHPSVANAFCAILDGVKKHTRNGVYAYKNAMAGGYRVTQWGRNKPSDAKNARDAAVRIARGWTPKVPAKAA